MAGRYGADSTGCRRIVDATTKNVYFLVADVHENAEDFEDSTFDLQVTDGAGAWHVLGARAVFPTRQKLYLMHTERRVSALPPLQPHTARARLARLTQSSLLNHCPCSMRVAAKRLESALDSQARGDQRGLQQSQTGSNTPNARCLAGRALSGTVTKSCQLSRPRLHLPRPYINAPLTCGLLGPYGCDLSSSS